MTPVTPELIIALKAMCTFDRIKIFNNSDQLIKARVGTDFPDNIEKGGEFQIYPGSGESWTRTIPQVVRICAYSLWHDFKLSPGSVVVFNMSHELEIDNADNVFVWDATQDGPHIG
jgi:hypothetical protein